MNLLIQHIPHAVPVVIIWGVMLRFWLVQRQLERRADGSAPAAPSPARPAVAAPAPAVRRSVALRGLLALGPVLGALATGLVIYALNLGRGHAAQAAIWTHVGISLLALLLVAYKVADIGLARLRESLTRHRVWRSSGSLVLLVLWVPLLVSGVALLIFPSNASFTAYAHLIASVWWTGLLLWHLRRHLVAATRAVAARPPSQTPSVALSRSHPAIRSPEPVRPAAGVPPVRRRPSSERAAPSAQRPPPVGDGEPAEAGGSAPISRR